MKPLFLATALVGCATEEDIVIVGEESAAIEETSSPGELVWSIGMPLRSTVDVAADRAGFVYGVTNVEDGLWLESYDHDAGLQWRREALGATAIAITSTSGAPTRIAVLFNTEEIDYAAFDVGCGPATTPTARYVASFDDGGDCVWMRPVGYAAFDVAIDEGRNVAVAGYRGFLEGAVTRFSATGAVTFDKTFTAGELPFWTVAMDPAGNVYVGGRITGVNAELGVGSADDTVEAALVAKLSSAGAVLWARTAGTLAEVTALDTGRVGQVAAGGTFRRTLDWGGAQVVSTTGANEDAFVVKLTTDGAPLFNRRVAGTATMSVEGLGVDNYGNVDVALALAPDTLAYGDRSSWSASIGSATYAVRSPAMMLLKLSPTNGYREWSTLTGGQPDGFVAPSGLAVAPHNNRILVTGERLEGDSMWGFLDRYYQ